jgi:AAA15 family ATPase/GTPase
MAINSFYQISGKKVRLDFIENYEPFKNSSFVIKENENIQVPLNSIGSGFEMIFSLIYSYYLSIQNNRKIIILIDEPELHLHPDIQKKFVEFLLKISKNSQVILTSHSPIFVKQLLYNDKVKTIIINNDKSVSNIGDFKLTYLSSNEINYLAFGLATEEYHNELYEELNYKYYPNESSIKEFDKKFFINDKGESKSSPWKGNLNEVSIHTFIRNQIHHRKDNGVPDYNDLKKSITTMRTYL